MEIIIEQTDPVLLIGEGNLTASVAVCLLNAGHQLDVYTSDEKAFSTCFMSHVKAQEYLTAKNCDVQNLKIYKDLPDDKNYKLAVLITAEDLAVKQRLINRVESVLNENAIIGINTESFSLDELTKGRHTKCSLIGLNWAEPAHSTFFLEIISAGDVEAAEVINNLGKSQWGKDPYIVKDAGIRSRLLSAMAREACFLVDNGYASVDDIDRACRNDAGYYLPFAGNCRYMDLMGTYAYGMVMKDLNPDLSKDTELPEFFKDVLDAGALGMENGKGFYNYTEEEVDNWKRTMDEFSFQIQAIIEKYPFNYK